MARHNEPRFSIGVDFGTNSVRALVVDVARQEGLLDGGGYRLVVNDGEDAGQTIFHAHFHVMGGEPLVAMG